MMGLLTGILCRAESLVGWKAWQLGATISDARDGISRDARSGVRAEIQTFLTTRRARISPEQAGYPPTAENDDESPGCAATKLPC